MKMTSEENLFWWVIVFLVGFLNGYLLRCYLSKEEGKQEGKCIQQRQLTDVRDARR